MGRGRLGHKTADEYGRVAAETARAMRDARPWSRARRVRQLRRLDAHLHRGGSGRSSTPTTSSTTCPCTPTSRRARAGISPASWPRASCWTGSSTRSSRRPMASVPRSAARSGSRCRSTNGTSGTSAASRRSHPRATGREAPSLAEDDYSVADAVVVGALLISLLRHADRVTCACLAQLVNVIAPIRAEAGGPAWRQTTFFPFSLTARHASGTVVSLELDVPMIDTAEHGPVPAVDGVATYDAASDAVSVFLVNRSATETVVLDLALDGIGGNHIVEHVVLADDDPHARTRPTPRPVSHLGAWCRPRRSRAGIRSRCPRSRGRCCGSSPRDPDTMERRHDRAAETRPRLERRHHPPTRMLREWLRRRRSSIEPASSASA